MSLSSTLFLLLLSSIAFAAPDTNELNQKFCQHLKTDLGPGSYRINPVLHHVDQGADYFIQRRGNQNIFFSPEGEFVLKAPLERYRDFIVQKDHVWTVGKRGLMQFTREGELVRRYIEASPRGMYYHAGSDILFLASGNDGLMAFDMSTKKLLFTHPLNTTNEDGQLSTAVAITGDGHNTLYIAMTGRTQYGFNGVVSFDLTQNQMSFESEYDKRRSGVIDIYPQIYNQASEVILNNGGWIHRVKKSDLRTKKKIRPVWKAIPHIMGSYRQYIRIEGDLIFDQDEVLGCGTFNIRDQRKTGVGAFSTNL